jgi:sugar (glycoside-pentoside-hexuronide) transporter
MTLSRLPTRTLIGYGIGSLGTGIFSTTPGVLLLYFLTDTLAVPAALAGIAVFLPKALDVLADPFVGLVSDRTRSRYGRRRPYLLAGALLMFFTYVFLFNVPESVSSSGAFWYVAGMFALSSFSYSLFSIPYVAMPAEMSDDPAERVRIVSWRMGFALTGAVIGSAIAPLLVGGFGGGRSGYAAMSWIVGGATAVAMLCTYCATRGLRLTEPPVDTTSMRDQFSLILRNRPFVTLAGSYLVQIVAIATLIASAPYFSAHIMGADETLVGQMLLVLMGAAVLSLPLWSYLSGRFGKRETYFIAMVLLACGALGLLTGSAQSVVALLAFLGLVGVGFGAQQVLPFAMLTDVIRYDTDRTGLRREGFICGVWVAAEKLGLAMGPLVAGLILQVSGFVGGVSRDQYPQTEQAIEGIRIAFAIAPALLVPMSLALLRRYRLN